MSGSKINSQTVFGCFELDLSGTIIYSKIPSDGIFGVRKSSVVGQNFFNNLIPFDSSEKFRRRFINFVNADKTMDEFNFECHFEDGSVAAKVLLINVKQRQYDEQNHLIIVDVRKI